MTQDIVKTPLNQSDAQRPVLNETVNQVEQDDLNVQSDWIHFMGLDAENIPSLSQDIETNIANQNMRSLEEETRLLEMQSGLPSQQKGTIEQKSDVKNEEIDLDEIETHAGYLAQKSIDFALLSMKNDELFQDNKKDQSEPQESTDHDLKTKEDNHETDESSLETQKTATDELSVEVQESVYLDPTQQTQKEHYLFKNAPEPQDADLPYDKSKRRNADLMTKDYPKDYKELAKRLNKPFTKITVRDLPKRYVNYHEGDYTTFSLYKTIITETNQQTDADFKQPYTLVLTASGKVLAQDVVDVLQNNMAGFIWVQHKNNRYSLFGLDGTAICDRRKRFRFIEEAEMGEGKLAIIFYGGKRIEYTPNFHENQKVSLSDDFDKENESPELKSHKLRNGLIALFALGTALSSYVGATHVFPELPKVEDMLPKTELKKMQNILKQIRLPQKTTQKEVFRTMQKTVQREN